MILASARRRYVILGTIAIAAIVAVAYIVLFSDSHVERHRTVLWAWERPTDLRWLDTEEYEVAYLASTYYILPDRIVEQPRRNILLLPPGIQATPVVRIETGIDTATGMIQVSAASDHRVDRVHIDELSALICRVFREHPGDERAIQIDFDARASERRFYAELLKRLRKSLPSGTHLAITALASWTVNDPWIDSLPIDEAIPMVFRMGEDDKHIRSYLARGGAIKSRVAANSIGIALDEPIAASFDHKRVYLFNNGPWTRLSLRRAMATISRNQHSTGQ